MWSPARDIAVVSDVMECARNIGRNIGCNWSGEILTIADPKEESYRYFVRVGKEEERIAEEILHADFMVHYEGAPADEYLLKLFTLKLYNAKILSAGWHYLSVRSSGV